jgi:phosphate transport system substrate-binding protein
MSSQRVVSFLLAAMLLTAAPAFGKELEIPGSTTFQKRILEPCAQSLEEATKIKVSVRGVNSGKGFEELVAGKVPASISSSPLPLLLAKAGLPNDGTYREHVIVKDVIVPIIHPQNSVTELSWQQLTDIHTGKIANWKELGGPDQKIVVVTSQPTSATRNVFQEVVMKGAPYVEGIREVRSTREELDLVSSFKGGIGAVSEGFLAMNPGKVKVVKTESISRPLSIITKGDPSPEVKMVIDFLLSPPAQALIK